MGNDVERFVSSFIKHAIILAYYFIHLSVDTNQPQRDRASYTD